MHRLLSKVWETRGKRKDDSDRGFTLIELLVVVVILGVLIAIAIPLYLNYRKGANDSAAQSDLKNAINVLEQCNADNSQYPTGSVLFAAGSSAAGTCTGQKINLSNGTSLQYTPAGTTGVSYIIADSNSSGSGKFYCYSSLVGGAIKTVAAPAASVALQITCP